MKYREKVREREREREREIVREIQKAIYKRRDIENEIYIVRYRCIEI